MFKKDLGTKLKNFRVKLELSQDELASMLEINRVSLSQIENGQREVTALELSRFAEAFNVSPDILLNFKQEVQVVLEKRKSGKQPTKEEIRISVPQKNVEKFKEVLLYILNKVGAKPNIGETVLYKLLYFIDFNFYEKYEEQLIGATYIKNQYGPTPLEFRKIIKEMEKNNELEKVESEYHKFPQRKYLPLRSPDLKKMTAVEITLIDDVLGKLSEMNVTEISEYSHNDVPWLTAEKGEHIDYEAVFYRTAQYSVRKYDEQEG